MIPSLIVAELTLAHSAREHVKRFFLTVNWEEKACVELIAPVIWSLKRPYTVRSVFALPKPLKKLRIF